MKKMHSKLSHLAILFSILFLMTSCLTYGSLEDTINKSFTVGPGGTLYLESDIGSIQVRGVRENKVDIEVIREVKSGSEEKAEQILKDFDIKFTQSGDDVRIEAKYEKSKLSRFWNNIGKYLKVKFIISVPDKYNLDLDTKGGSISVDDIQGVVKSRTSGGSLRFDRIEGEISGKTSGGSIEIGEVKGNTDVDTSGGSIRISHAQGPVDAHTSGGSITVEEVRGTIKADTSGGSIKAYISSQPQSDCRLTTSGGSITVHLEDDIGMNVNAKTSGGRVHSDFPVTLKGEIDRSVLNTKINDGGPELYLRTSGGSIYLRKY